MKENRPKHSGFEAPTIGEAFPRGTKFKKNSDGTMTPIYPNQNEAKGTNVKRPEHSGFEAPTIGHVLPDGTKWKKNPDGTMTPIYPEQKVPTEE